MPRSGWAWVGIAYGVMSVVTFVVYGVDKSRARRGAWRVSESALHLLELLFGWPGALVAQSYFRHKRQKARFYLMTWLVVATHVAFWAWWWLRA